MIRLFGKTDTDFSSNGDIVLNPIKARVRNEDNGEFYLNLETDLTYVDDLTDGRIIVANTPKGYQAFRVRNPIKTKNRITAKCKHVFYDSLNYLIADSYVVDRDLNDALDHLNSATEPLSEFTTISDVTTVNSFRCVRKSLYEAVFALIERWGGHLDRDNFSIGIRATLGTDNGVTVRYGKNIKEITAEENWDDVVTKLMPVGHDGLLLPEVYLESSTQYEIPYTKTVSFNQNLDRDNYTDEDGNFDEEAYNDALVEDLRVQAQAYLDEYCIPKVNYTLRANLDKVTGIGDTIEVIDERLGINLMTNVIAYEYDCLSKQYVTVEFGNFKQSLSNLISGITSNVDKTIQEETQTLKITLGEELSQATQKILSMMGNSYVIYDGNQILVVDSLPKETAHYVIRINSGGIGFSNTGISGTFNSAWTIDGTMDMQQMNVINLTANLIKGGTLKLGSEANSSGVLEIYDNENNLIGLMDKDGLKMYGLDGSYVLMNNEVGFAGFDKNNNKIYWVSQDEFHMKKSVVEEEITLCGQLRFIPIQITDNGTVVNEGIGLVSSYTGG